MKIWLKSCHRKGPGSNKNGEILIIFTSFTKKVEVFTKGDSFPEEEWNSFYLLDNQLIKTQVNNEGVWASRVSEFSSAIARKH